MNGTAYPAAPHNRRYKITDLNPHLMCVLCGGYYIDATTIIECLHSFCRTCIVRCLETSKFCPICDVQVHKTKPLLNIRSDQTLQDIVYKLVPGLFQREMKRRRDFYAKQPQECSKNSNPRSSEERGEVDCDLPMNIFMPDEFISIALEYIESYPVTNGGPRKEMDKSMTNCQRFLRCPVYITVAHIKKLIRAKCGLSSECDVNLMVSQDRLSDDYMLMDVAYMYSWKRKGPLKLYFNIVKQPTSRLKLRNYNLASYFNGQRTKPNGLAPPPSATATKGDSGAVVASVMVNGGHTNSSGDATSDKKPVNAATTDSRLSSAASSERVNSSPAAATKCNSTPVSAHHSTSSTESNARPRKKAKMAADAVCSNEVLTNGTSIAVVTDNNNESGAEDREAKTDKNPVDELGTEATLATAAVVVVTTNTVGVTDVGGGDIAAPTDAKCETVSGATDKWDESAVVKTKVQSVNGDADPGKSTGGVKSSL